MSKFNYQLLINIAAVVLTARAVSVQHLSSSLFERVDNRIS